MLAQLNKHHNFIFRSEQRFCRKPFSPHHLSFTLQNHFVEQQAQCELKTGVALDGPRVWLLHEIFKLLPIAHDGLGVQIFHILPDVAPKLRGYLGKKTQDVPSLPCCRR